MPLHGSSMLCLVEPKRKTSCSDGKTTVSPCLRPSTRRGLLTWLRVLLLVLRRRIRSVGRVHSGTDWIDASGGDVDCRRRHPSHLACLLHVVVNHFHVWRQRARVFALVDGHVVFQITDDILCLRSVLGVDHG